MKALVTGAAGFIGSTLSESLLQHGYDVRGVDCFTRHYDGETKRANLAVAMRDQHYEFLELDLSSADLGTAVDNVDVVFHLAAQPGIRGSWDHRFAEYVQHNIVATQRLLEACVGSPIGRFVYASSSSVYGDHAAMPAVEEQLPRPHSPYGVTKLAGEQLCGVYDENFGVPTVALRYFTVYGPRQRPDMAIHRVIESVLAGERFELFGSGDQIRDFTFVGDIARATRLAAEMPRDAAATVMNVAGGTAVEMNELLEMVGVSLGRPVKVERLAEQAGDVRRTEGSIERASAVLGWKPEVDLQAGIAAQVEWHLQRRDGR
jgi:nucleoside-diphosphate-sugar epimerase